MLVVHASDLHLGRPLWSLPIHSDLDLDVFATAAWRSLTRLVDLCIAEHVQLLLIAGDLIECSVRDYKVGLRLVHELSRLESTGTRVVWVRGNHDAENRVMKNLLLPGHVFQFGLSGVQTELFEDCGALVVGKSYDRRSCTEDLLATYRPPAQNTTTIGLLHTSGDGAITGDRYASCRRRELLDKGYAYLALGHVHEPTILSPRVAYSGCLQARSFLEAVARGCLLVRFEGGTVTLDVVRSGTLQVDLSSVRILDDVGGAIEAVTERALRRHAERVVVARYRLSGDAGAELPLAMSCEARGRLLYAHPGGQRQRIAVDGFWLELECPEQAPLCLTHTGQMRGDVYWSRVEQFLGCPRPPRSRMRRIARLASPKFSLRFERGRLTGRIVS